MQYTALMIDIMDSRKIDKRNRTVVQYFIKTALQALNALFKPSLVFDVIFSAGDEMQGLFDNTCSAVLYFRLMKMLLLPLGVRCGIGVGDWDIQIQDGLSTEQDGPAYHRARTAIKRAHETTTMPVLLHSGNEADLPVNTLLNASCLLSQKQSRYQNRIQLLIELLLPFYDETLMAKDQFSYLCSLLHEREKITFFTGNQKEKRIIFNESIDWIALQDPIFIFDDSLFLDHMVIESTIKKGTSTKLAKITKTTRQNMDNVIRKADIQMIRNIDLTALYVIHKFSKR
ncbi:MAG: hypothetical protein KBG64_03850 [Clostridia bacterium]|nr:hypothetical protein [Clostridia bacterium]